VRSSTSAPGAHEVVIQPCTDQGAGNGNQASGPLLHNFPARLHGNALDHPGYEALDHPFFQQLPTDIYTGGTGGGNPELCCLLVGVVFETVKQTEFLNRAQRDAGKNAEIGQDGDESTNAQAGSLGCRDFHATANNTASNVIQM